MPPICTSFDPEPRREPSPVEFEIMKGRGSVQKWFYVEGAENAKTLVRLGRNYGFPTGIVRGPIALPGYEIQP